LEYGINHKKDIVESSTDELGNVITNTRIEEFKFKYTYEDNNIIIRNENTKEEVKIECEQLIDFIVMEDIQYQNGLITFKILAMLLGIVEEVCGENNIPYEVVSPNV
jgi:hypothetical protein